MFFVWFPFVFGSPVLFFSGGGRRGEGKDERKVRPRGEGERCKENISSLQGNGKQKERG